MEFAIGEGQLVVHRSSRLEEDGPDYLRLRSLFAIYLVDPKNILYAQAEFSFCALISRR